MGWWWSFRCGMKSMFRDNSLSTAHSTLGWCYGCFRETRSCVPLCLKGLQVTGSCWRWWFTSLNDAITSGRLSRTIPLACNLASRLDYTQSSGEREWSGWEFWERSWADYPARDTTKSHRLLCRPNSAGGRVWMQIWTIFSQDVHESDINRYVGQSVRAAGTGGGSGCSDCCG